MQGRAAPEFELYLSTDEGAGLEICEPAFQYDLGLTRRPPLMRFDVDESEATDPKPPSNMSPRCSREVGLMGDPRDDDLLRTMSARFKGWCHMEMDRARILAGRRGSIIKGVVDAPSLRG